MTDETTNARKICAICNYRFSNDLSCKCGNNLDRKSEVVQRFIRKQEKNGYVLCLSVELPGIEIPEDKEIYQRIDEARAELRVRINQIFDTFL